MDVDKSIRVDGRRSIYESTLTFSDSVGVCMPSYCIAVGTVASWHIRSDILGIIHDDCGKINRCNVSLIT